MESDAYFDTNSAPGSGRIIIRLPYADVTCARKLIADLETAVKQAEAHNAKPNIIKAEELEEGAEYEGPDSYIYVCDSVTVDPNPRDWKLAVTVNNTGSYSYCYPLGQPVRLISRKGSLT